MTPREIHELRQLIADMKKTAGGSSKKKAQGLTAEASPEVIRDDDDPEGSTEIEATEATTADPEATTESVELTDLSGEPTALAVDSNLD